MLIYFVLDLFILYLKAKAYLTLMLEMHLKHPGFTKNKERIQKFKGTGDTKYVFKK